MILGQDVRGIVDALRNWPIDHIGVVKKARGERFDPTHDREHAS